jgi:hypothetical protein
MRHQVGNGKDPFQVPKVFPTTKKNGTFTDAFGSTEPYRYGDSNPGFRTENCLNALRLIAAVSRFRSQVGDSGDLGNSGLRLFAVLCGWQATSCCSLVAESRHAVAEGWRQVQLVREGAKRTNASRTGGRRRR